MSRAALPWLVAGVAGVALVATLARGPRAHAATHPEPRPGITAARVLPSIAVPHTPGALEAYEAARRMPMVLDGLYCYCHCKEAYGHRSLLTCFESEHGGNCDICMGEAMLATRLAASGASLAAIRQAIDERFGG
jgi:Protein of unknown function with PCYCGC motif